MPREVVKMGTFQTVKRDGGYDGLRRLEYAILEEVSAGPWCNHAKLRRMRHLYRQLVKKYGRR